MKDLVPCIPEDILEGVFRLNVAAIIINEENKILLCRRNKNKKVAPGAWHMPGGKVEIGESIENAITRELSEELGIQTIDVIGFSGVIHDYFVEKQKHRTIFVGVHAKGTIQMNYENDASEYVFIEEIEDYLEPELVSYNERAAAFGIMSTKLRSRVFLPKP